MAGLELNKIFSAILLSCLIIMVVSNVVDIIYQPEKVTKRGFHIEVAEIEVKSEAAPPPVNILQLLTTANIENGKVVAKKCVSCHTFNKGDPNKIGPNLWGIVGNKKGHLGDKFNYSKSLLEKGGSWPFEELAAFLKKPQSYIPGTKMSFIGLSDPKQIADVIVYLNSMSDTPIALPASENDAPKQEL